MISQAGHSIPEVGYDSFADCRFDGIGLIIDFDPHVATKGAKLCHLWRVFNARERLKLDNRINPSAMPPRKVVPPYARI